MRAKVLAAAVALATAGAARGETLRCSFSRGILNTAVENVTTGEWSWMSPRRPDEFFKDVKPGATFWFATATYTAGRRAGTLAGSASSPATDASPAEVAYGAASVSFVDVTDAGSVLTLTVSTERGHDGTFSAVYSRHTSSRGMLLVSQYWGACR